MLNLLRYSQLLALAVLLAVVVALSLLYRGLVFDAMVEAETHASVALTKTFANAIWPAHASFVKRAATLERQTLAGRARSPRSIASCGSCPPACRWSRSRSTT
jgi:hypothetical protein